MRGIQNRLREEAQQHQQHHQQQPADQQPHSAAHFAASRFRRICLFLRLFCFGILDLFNRNLNRSGDLRLAPLCCSALFRGQFRFVILRLRRLIVLIYSPLSPNLLRSFFT